MNQINIKNNDVQKNGNNYSTKNNSRLINKNDDSLLYDLPLKKSSNNFTAVPTKKVN